MLIFNAFLFSCIGKNKMPHPPLMQKISAPINRLEICVRWDKTEKLLTRDGKFRLHFSLNVSAVNAAKSTS